jgi:hypothetical protein
MDVIKTGWKSQKRLLQSASGIHISSYKMHRQCRHPELLGRLDELVPTSKSICECDSFSNCLYRIRVRP